MSQTEPWHFLVKGLAELPYPVILNARAQQIDDSLTNGSIMIAVDAADNEFWVTLPSTRKRYRLPLNCFAPITPRNIHRAASIPISNSGDDGPRHLPLQAPRFCMDDLVLDERLHSESLALVERLKYPVSPEVLSKYGRARQRNPFVILDGPTGTGKTMLAEAIAESIGARLARVGAAITGSSYISVAERAVDEVFRVAHHASPAVVVLLDDGEELVEGRTGQSSARFRDGAVASLLQSLERHPRAVAVLTTNSQLAQLDPAVLSRSTRIRFRAPTSDQRRRLVQRLLVMDRVDTTVDLRALTESTLSLREIAVVCELMAEQAARRETRENQAQRMTPNDLEQALRGACRTEDRQPIRMGR